MPSKTKSNVSASRRPALKNSAQTVSVKSEKLPQDDDSKACTPTDSTQTITKHERLTYSDKIIEAFRPIQLTFQWFGMFPFHIKTKSNGVRVLRFKLRHRNTYVFLFTLSVTGLVFVFTSAGFISMYLGYGRSTVTNRCKNTWEEARLKRYVVPIAITWTWLCSTVLAGVSVLFRARHRVHFFNYWKRAVQTMHMNATEGARKKFTRAIWKYIILSVVYVIVVLFFRVDALHESAGGIVNAMIRMWTADIGLSDKLLGISADCSTRDVVQVDYAISYKLWKWFGILVQLYTLLGSQFIVMQFQFFCMLLKNVATIWNARLENALNFVTPKPTDTYRRRLEYRHLMKDHLILSQLFKLTEEFFSLTLSLYYLLKIVVMCFAIYFLSQVTASDTCESIFKAYAKSEYQACLFGSRNDPGVTGFKKEHFFDDPCDPKTHSSVEDGIVAMVLLGFTVLSWYGTTNDSSSAHEEAMRGYDILRRHGFMLSKSRKERNFIQSLRLNFAKSSPMQISPGGYFTINREYLIIALNAVFMYWIILLQFRPGEFDIEKYCEGKTNKSAGSNFHVQPVESEMHVSIPCTTECIL